MSITDTAAGRHDHVANADGNIELRRQENLLKAGALQDAIFNSAFFSSIATDEKGVIQIFNIGAERMLGYTAAEVMNRITPADISDPQEVINRAKALSVELNTTITPGFEALVFKASRGIEDIYELTYVRKDGSRFPAIVSVTALRDAGDDIIGYLLIGTDNTARKQVEAAQALLDQRLRDQQFYTRSLIESNIDALMMTDPQGIISDVNQQMVALTGRTRDELIGAPCKNFFTDPLRADAAIQRVLREHKVSNYELTVRSQNGDETVVSYNAATFHDRDRTLRGVFAAARDVTERKRFEHTLEVKNIELQRASQMKSEFLATMSHELRTPLNAIIGFSEALKDGLVGPTTAMQHEYIDDIFTSGQHLLSLINDILDLSKVEAGMMALELEAVDLRVLLSNSLTIVREKAAAQHIALTLEIEHDLGILQLDMRKTKQIVYNLLSNAVKFSANGGPVALRARRVPRSAVGIVAGPWPVQSFPLAYNEYNEFLEIDVSDCGIGISPEGMAKLFQAFSQIDSSLARKFEGTGLGLAMVRQLAELQGGAVAVASGEGEGARFVTWLPLRNPAQSQRASQHGADTARGDSTGQRRVALLVSNNEPMAERLRLLLEEEGYTVQRAASAEAALHIGPLPALRLILLDMLLPGIDGWQFLHLLREQGALASVPVIMLANPAHGMLTLVGGAATLLHKPLAHGQLQGALTSLGLPAAPERPHTVLVVDDDPQAVELIAAWLPMPAYIVLRAYGGAEAVTLARHVRPDLIVLDLTMPGLSGTDLIDALRRQPDTARIPLLLVADRRLPGAGRAGAATLPQPLLPGGPAGLNQASFITEVRRTLSPHQGAPDGQSISY